MVNQTTTSKLDAITQAILGGSTGPSTSQLLQAVQAQQPTGVQLADRLSQLGAGAAIYGDQRNAAMQGFVNSMTGKGASAQDAAMARVADLDANDPAQQQQILNILKASDPAKAVEFARAIQTKNKALEQGEVVAEQATSLGFPEVAAAVRSQAITPEKAMEMISPTNRASIQYNDRMATVREKEAEGTLSYNQARLEEAAITRNMQQERIDMERERLELQKKELRLMGQNMTAGEQNLATSLQGEVQAETGIIQQMSSLAFQFERAEINSGARAAGSRKLREIIGSQNREDALRESYLKLRNSFTLENLPPGAASDNDVRIAMQGWPDENAAPEYIAAFLRGQAKLQAISTGLKNEQIRFMIENGGAGRVSAEGEVTTFQDIRTDLLEDPAFIERVERATGVTFATPSDDNYFTEERRQRYNELKGNIDFLMGNESTNPGAQRRSRRGN